MICIIGVDAATKPAKVGLARGFLKTGRLALDQLKKPVNPHTVASVVSDWVSPEYKTLIAIDAPLGWPADLGRTLVEHAAGELVGGQSNDLFRRETDRFVYRAAGKQSLDVGADRIARTAHAALGYLDGVRAMTDLGFPMLWSNDPGSQDGVVEVYPAATLRQSGYPSQGYKGNGGNDQRKEVLDLVSQRNVDIKVERQLMIEDDDLLDAAVCVLAGAHFINGLCYEPENLYLAKKEGWIWVRRPAN